MTAPDPFAGLHPGPYYRDLPTPPGIRPDDFLSLQEHFDRDPPRAICRTCRHFLAHGAGDRLSPGDCHLPSWPYPSRWTLPLWVCGAFSDVRDAKPGDGSVHPAIAAAVARGWRNFHRSGDL